MNELAIAYCPVMKFTDEGSVAGVEGAPAGNMRRTPDWPYPTAVRLPATPIASNGISDAPAPGPATVTVVVELPGLAAPERVSIRRSGLKKPPVPSAVSNLAVLTRRHMLGAAPVALWIHRTPLASRTCSKLLGR